MLSSVKRRLADAWSKLSRLLHVQFQAVLALRILRIPVIFYIAVFIVERAITLRGIEARLNNSSIGRKLT